MVKMFLLLILINQALSLDLKFEDFINSTPKTYGILTIVRQTDLNELKTVNQFIRNYASLQCENFAEFVVVWESSKDPFKTLRLEKNSFSKNVYFVQNSKTRYTTSQRFYLSQQSSQQVYLSLDIGLNISCSDLTSDFKTWQNHTYGIIGPLMTYAPKTQDYVGRYWQDPGIPFSYHDVENQYFSIALTGASWISAHFLRLMTISKLPDVLYIRERGDNVLGCEDIGLNFVISHFYPELLNYELINQDINENQKFKDYLLRPQIPQCAEDYSKYLSYSPIRIFFRSSFPQVHDPYVKQINKHSIYLKYKYYENVMALYQGKPSMFKKSDLKYIELNTYNQIHSYQSLKVNLTIAILIVGLTIGYFLGKFSIKLFVRIFNRSSCKFLAIISEHPLAKKVLEYV